LKPEIKERVYLLIIIFCMFMCAAMVLTMITGGVKNGDETHVPVSRPIISDADTTDQNGEVVQNQDANQQDTSTSPDDKDQGNVLSPNDDGIVQTEGQIAITEDFINEQWGRFLPSDFPHIPASAYHLPAASEIPGQHLDSCHLPQYAPGFRYHPPGR